MDLKDNWYYVQVFTEGKVGGMYTICFAPNKTEAEQSVKNWLISRGYDPELCRVHYYLKNYKRKAAKMVADNNYITV